MVSTLHSLCSSASFILSARFAASTTLDVDDVDAADADADALALSGIAHPLRIPQHWIVVEKKEGHRRIATTTPHHRTAIPSHYRTVRVGWGTNPNPTFHQKKTERFGFLQTYFGPQISLTEESRADSPFSIPSQRRNEQNAAQLAPSLPLFILR